MQKCLKSRKQLETTWTYLINERDKNMKNPEQLKGAIRNIAREKNLHAQEILQFFFFERLLDRLSQSDYRKNFILKGGLLISSMIGVSERTTMDMDTTVQGISMESANIERVMREIISIDVNDGISFILSKMEPIREDDEYENYRIHLTAEYGKIKNPIKIDVTTGDHVTPDAVEYGFHSLFDEKIIPVNAYQLETILAEKYETILRRGIGNTRARDYYDLYALFHLYRDTISVDLLKLAIRHTAETRNSLNTLSNYIEICEEVKHEQALINLWQNYTDEYSYANHISFENVVDNVKAFGDYIESN